MDEFSLTFNSPTYRLYYLTTMCVTCYSRYNVLARQLPENVSNVKCQMVLQKFDPQAKDWQMGHTKVS